MNIVVCCHNCGKTFEYKPIPGFRQEFHYCRTPECMAEIKARADSYKTRRSLLQEGAIALVAGSALLETSCTASEITQAIDIAQIAISGIVTGLTVTGTIPAALQPTILGWAQQATNFVGETITELSSKDTDVVKAEVITQQVAAVVTTYKNLSQQAQTLVEVAEQDVESILNLVSNSATPLVVSRGVAKRRGVTVHMLDVANRAKLAQIKARNDADVQKLNAFKPRP